MKSPRKTKLTVKGGEMSQTRPEQLVRRIDDAVEPKRGSGVNIWSIFGGAALVVLAAAVIVNLPDIKRYIRISNM
jgi:hypothetical protein